MSELFVTCSSGIEPLLVEELAELGFQDVTGSYRGVYVKTHSPEETYHAIYRINYCSRLATRVLLPLAHFKCFDQRGLYRGVSGIDWMRYLPRSKTFAIDSTGDHPQLTNRLFAAQVAKDAICDQIRSRCGERPSVNVHNPDVQLHLFLDRNSATMSFDTSGNSLHKRGYRQESVEAPLRETLAAALLRLAQYRPEEILYDPCCGSGTLLIEAGLYATKTPPGFLRTQWGFVCLPEFSQQAWLKVKQEADEQRTTIPAGHLIGTDINKNAVHVCKVNLRATGLHKVVEVVQSDFRDYIPTVAPTFLISNPPHGKRLEDPDHLRPLYRALGDFMKQRMAKPARGFVFTGSLDLSKEIGLAAKKRHVIDNSGIDSRLLEFDLY